MNGTANGNRKPVCKVHHEPLQLNCLNCDQIICKGCEKGDHRNHNTENLGKAFDRLLEKFQSGGERVEDVMEQLDEKLSLVDISVRNIQEVFGNCKNNVEGRAVQLINQLQEDKETLKSLLEARKREELAKLESIRQQIQKEMKEYEQLKDLMDSKKAALITSVATDLRCDFHCDEAKSLEVMKVSVQHPRFVPLPPDLHCLDGNRVGKIEFSEQTAKLKCQNTIKGLTLQEKLSKKMKATNEIVIPTGSSFHFAVINNELWVPVHGEDIILVYSSKGEVISKINVSKANQTVWGLKYQRSWQGINKATFITAPRSVCQFTAESVLVASDSGIYEMTMGGEIKSFFMGGQFCDVALDEDKERFCALDYGNKKCVIFQADTKGKWEKHNEFCLKECKVDHYASILFSDDSVIICPGGSHVLQVYQLNGSRVEQFGSYGRGEPGQLWGPSLCSLDYKGNILVADVNNKRLQILDEKKKWVVIYVEGLTYPFDVVVTVDGLWALVQHNGTKYKLVHYVYV